MALVRLLACMLPWLAHAIGHGGFVGGQQTATDGGLIRRDRSRLPEVGEWRWGDVLGWWHRPSTRPHHHQLLDHQQQVPAPAPRPTGAATEPYCDQGFNAPSATYCPNSVWVDDMVAADPSPKKVIVNIGCNKGNGAIAWMERFDTSSVRFWDSQRWTKYLREELNITNFACKPEKPAVTAYNVEKSSTTSGVPIGVCVEPMRSNVDLLQKASSAFKYGPSGQYGAFHVVHAAVTDVATQNQTVDFPDLAPGTEQGRLQALFRSPVQMKTVDGIVSELSLPKVDILLIDTEGYDSAVLEGAWETLSSVRYLEFEVHRDLPSSPWNRTTLKSVVSKLDRRGFDCYWAGNNARLLSMNKCWNSRFEWGAWANAACVKRADAWSDVMMKFAGINWFKS